MEESGLLSWSYKLGHITKSDLELLNVRFPIEKRIDVIENQLLPKFSNGIWGVKEFDLLNSEGEKISKELKLHEFSLEERIHLALVASSQVMSESNKLYDMWKRALNFNEDLTISEIMYEISYTFLRIKEQAEILYRKVYEISRARFKKDIKVKSFSKDIESRYSVIVLLLLRIFSIMKSLVKQDVETSLKQARFLAIERSRFLFL